MMNGSIYISSVFIHDETPPTEKAKEKVTSETIIISGKHQEMATVLSIALASSLIKAWSLYYSVCGMKFQIVPTYTWNLAHIHHLTNLEVTYQNIFLINRMNVTQQI